MTRTIFVSIIGTLLVTMAATLLPRSASAADSPLRPCEIPGVEGHALCGTLRVFEDREAGAGRTIDLKVVVLRAMYRKAEPDPVFVFAGGPGQAATDYAATMGRLLNSVRQKRDIVLVDQRGTGRSHGLECPDLTAREQLELLLAEELPEEAIARCRSKLEKKADLTLYSTPIAMDDIDDVREWLGYETINLFGISYGTRAALVYTRRYPDRVRTMTLRAMYFGNMIHTARDAQTSLDRLFEDCSREDRCSRAYQNLEAELDAVLERLDRSPASVRVRGEGGRRARVPVTRAMFAGAIRQSLYTAGSQREIPHLIHSAYEENYTPLARALEQHLGIVRSISLGMLMSVLCPETVAEIPVDRIDEETANTFMGGLFLEKAISACKAWPSSHLPDNFSDPFESTTPTLIISGEIDPVTPSMWGDEAAKHLSNSSHIVLKGIAHDAPPSCALDAIATFIDEADPSGLESACEGETERRKFK